MRTADIGSRVPDAELVDGVVVEGRPTDAARHVPDEPRGSDEGRAYIACRLPLAHFGPGGPSLYPDGIAAMLQPGSGA